MVAFLLERDRTCESMTSLSEAFRRKQAQLKQLLMKGEVLKSLFNFVVDGIMDVVEGVGQFPLLLFLEQSLVWSILS
uniref:Uncharacterized protein n=1 Tax=Ascaris lumbricoides TaxID=6252 RepID=A0A0M3IWY5_ASCLU